MAEAFLSIADKGELRDPGQESRRRETMKAICVDDEPLTLEYTVEMCRKLPQIHSVEGFTHAGDALAWLENQTADMALLDIDLPDMNGLELAAHIKELSPDTAIIFLTGYSQYALDAFAVHAVGYLLKPVGQEKLADTVAWALRGRKELRNESVFVRTFGEFELFADGKPVSFKLAKSKEILAYLVNKQGSGATRAEIFSAIWEDRAYDRGMQKQLDVYIRSMRETLRGCGIEDMVELNRGSIRVRPETFTCDAYLFFAGDSDAVNAYRGEYMSAYSWASITESMMYWQGIQKTGG